MNQFARDLYASLAGAGVSPANLVCSPASIAIALAMVREGAVGATADQIDAVVQIGDRAEMMNAFRALHDGAAIDADLQLAIVNSMFVQRGYELVPTFLDLIASRYGSAVEAVDFGTDPEHVRLQINTWVEGVTNERISALLGPGSVDPDVRLMLVNAIYMKARWRFPFPPTTTADADFTCLDGIVRAVPTMRLVAGLPYAVGAGWRSVELPYLPGTLSMTIVVPDAGEPLSTGVDIATSSVRADRARVAVALPRFDIETASSLGQPLAGLGMPDAFRLEVADFRGITTSEPMCIGDVVHQANITVDEEGTEAAAATAAAMAGSAMVTDPPIEFRVDRPFVFGVRDEATRALLFLGHVGDPSLRRRAAA